MRNNILLFLIITAVLMLSACKLQQGSSSHYEKAKEEIKSMMLQQVADWNHGDLEAFMQGYIKSDKLKFIGGNGITYGWQQILENYKKGYPTKDHKGILTFNLLEFDQLADDVFLVIGEFNIKRSLGDANGIFSVILKRIDGAWKIIADHSSSSS